MRRAATSLSFFVATLMLVVDAAGAGPQEDLKVCAVAAEDGQSLTADGKLQGARQKLLLCAREECPAMIKKDCQKWLEDLAPRVPTVVIAASDQKGEDVSDVRVLIDGVTATERFEGVAIPVDPGTHVFRFEVPGAAPTEQRLVIREGEKDRVVHVVFEGVPAVAARSGDSGSSTPARDTTSSRGNSTGLYLTAAVAVAGLGTFGVFAIKGIADRNDLEHSCSPFCSSSQIDSVHNEFIVADIALGVGAVATGAFAWLFFTNTSHSKPKVTAAVAPHGRGAFAEVGLRF